jgi:multiple antibiotic resistance protein
VLIKFFFLLGPFFVVSMFLSMTRGQTPARQRQIATRVTVAVLITCLVLYFFGNFLFDVLGITVDAFRVGAGVLLFLLAVKLVYGRDDNVEAQDGEISVVPLAIPFTVGPATTGALLVMGAEVHQTWERVIGCLALCSAVLMAGIMLHLATAIERLLGDRGLRILSKLTGLMLAALAAQIVFTGIRNLMSSPAAGN